MMELTADAIERMLCDEITIVAPAFHAIREGDTVWLDAQGRAHNSPADPRSDIYLALYDQPATGCYVALYPLVTGRS